MHLLPVEHGVIDGGDQAVDLGLSPADIVVLSAADSELALLAKAWKDLAGELAEPPRLRLANALQLKHNFSVDLFVDRTLVEARLIIVRLLGGESYWPYGFERIEALARRKGIGLALLPGCPKPDASLLARSTIAHDEADAMWRCLVEGGADNATRVLRHAVALVRGETTDLAPAPLAPAGVYADRAAESAVGRAVVIVYRALVQAADTAAVDALLDALAARKLHARAIYVTSLRDPAAADVLAAEFAANPPDIVLNATAFQAGLAEPAAAPGPFAASAPWLQVVFSGQSRESWIADRGGLPPRDVAMHVVLPEFDGRIATRAVAFKADAGRDPLTELRVVRLDPDEERMGFVADLAAAWVRLRRSPIPDRRVAIVLANYPNADHKIANAVGLDTPASCCAVLDAMADAGYLIADPPASSAALVDRLLAGPTNALVTGREIRATLPLAVYRRAFATLPCDIREAVTAQWGAPETDHFCLCDAFALPVLTMGHVVVGLQPARGYHVDPKATYHDPALVPPHGYFAFYFWLRMIFSADAVVHLGKHGNLEWLPGKALALSAACYPEAILGPLPNIYPFIVNDPGEGTQAKRRTAAVVVDHLPPPLTTAGTYGALEALEGLIDEYYEAQRLDRRRAEIVARRILEAAGRLGLDADLGIARSASIAEKLTRLDAYLCDLKDLQIRGGLHIFGRAPEQDAETDMLLAMLRARRGPSDLDAPIAAALAADIEIDDPCAVPPSTPWTGARPSVLRDLSESPWRTAADTAERLDGLARALLDGTRSPDPAWSATRRLLDHVASPMRDNLRRSGPAEIAGLLRGLAGQFVAPGPSGAPSRGRPDVLPTGRNFYTLDTRTVPTPAAWEIGTAAAEAMVTRYFQDHGDWPSAVALSAWGTANMRTGGDDIAQALALMGARPTWDHGTRRVTGFEILPLARLGRPRVDVTLKISGSFRDAFPTQIDLVDSAVRAIAARDEPDEENPIAVRVRAETARLTGAGLTHADALRQATFRVFGARPGTYGAGLGTVVEEGIWSDAADLARVFVDWGQYAYGSGVDGAAARDAFTDRLGRLDAVLHNQDNRERDILDSDDDWQFAGGLASASRTLQDRRLPVYFGDTSGPRGPQVRTLEEEISRVVRGRAVNPKWIEAMMRHGFKGAFEIAATVEFLYAFAATADAVADHHFDAVYQAYVLDDRVRAFLERTNPGALRAIKARLDEAICRGLWTPGSNSARAMLDQHEEALR